MRLPPGSPRLYRRLPACGATPLALSQSNARRAQPGSLSHWPHVEPQHFGQRHDGASSRGTWLR